MKTYIALLRGINVGGKNSLPMKELVAALEGIGARQVKTYVQSGNAVFQSAAADGARLARKLAAVIERERGFEPHVFIFERSVLDDAIAHNPFPAAEADPVSLHLGILAAVPPQPNLAQLESLKKPSENFRLLGSLFYLHAPEGIGRSKLAASSEKLLGVAMTDRNWRTVCKLRELADEPWGSIEQPRRASRKIK